MYSITHRFQIPFNNSTNMCCEYDQCECTHEEAASALVNTVASLLQDRENHNSRSLQTLHRKVGRINQYKQNLLGPDTDATIVKCQTMITRFQKALQSDEWIFFHLDNLFGGNVLLWNNPDPITVDCFLDNPRLVIVEKKSPVIAIHSLQGTPFDGKLYTVTLSPLQKKDVTLDLISYFFQYHLIFRLMRNNRLAANPNDAIDHNCPLIQYKETSTFQLFLPEGGTLKLFTSSFGDKGDYSLKFFDSIFQKAVLALYPPQAIAKIKIRLLRGVEVIPIENLKSDQPRDYANNKIYYSFMSCDDNEKCQVLWKSIHPGMLEVIEVVETVSFEKIEQSYSRYVETRKKALVDWLKATYKEHLIEFAETDNDIDVAPTDYFIVYDPQSIADQWQVKFVFVDSSNYLNSRVCTPSKIHYNENMAIYHFHQFKKDHQKKMVFSGLNIVWSDEWVNVKNLNNSDILLYPHRDHDYIMVRWLNFENSFINFEVLKSHLEERLNLYVLKRLFFPHLKTINESFGRELLGFEQKATYIITPIAEKTDYSCQLYTSYPTRRESVFKASTLEALMFTLKYWILGRLTEYKDELKKQFHLPCFLIHNDLGNAKTGFIIDFYTAMGFNKGWKGKLTLFPVHNPEMLDSKGRKNLIAFMNGMQKYLEREDAVPLSSDPDEGLLIETSDDFSTISIEFNNFYLHDEVNFKNTVPFLEKLLEKGHEAYNKFLIMHAVNRRFGPTPKLLQSTFMLEDSTLCPGGELKYLITLYNAEKNLSEDQERYKKSLVSAIKAIEDNEDVSGAPENPKDRLEFFKTLKIQLSHVIFKLRKDCDPILKRRIILDLAEGFSACAGRWAGTVVAQYNHLMGKQTNQLVELCLQITDKIKIGLIETIVSADYDSDVHAYVGLCAGLRKEGILIPGAGTTHYEDPYKLEDVEMAIEEFKRLFHAYEIVEITKQQLNQALKDPKNPYNLQVLEVLRSYGVNKIQLNASYQSLQNEHACRKYAIENAQALNEHVRQAVIDRGRQALGEGLNAVFLRSTPYGVHLDTVYQKSFAMLDAANEDPEGKRNALNRARTEFTNLVKALPHELIVEEDSRHKRLVSVLADQFIEENKLIEWNEDTTVMQLTLEGVIAVMCGLGLLQEKKT